MATLERPHLDALRNLSEVSGAPTHAEQLVISRAGIDPTTDAAGRALAREYITTEIADMPTKHTALALLARATISGVQYKDTSLTPEERSEADRVKQLGAMAENEEYSQKTGWGNTKHSVATKHATLQQQIRDRINTETQAKEPDNTARFAEFNEILDQLCYEADHGNVSPDNALRAYQAVEAAQEHLFYSGAEVPGIEPSESNQDTVLSYAIKLLETIEERYRTPLYRNQARLCFRKAEQFRQQDPPDTAAADAAEDQANKLLADALTYAEICEQNHLEEALGRGNKYRDTGYQRLDNILGIASEATNVQLQAHALDVAATYASSFPKTVKQRMQHKGPATVFGNPKILGGIERTRTIEVEKDNPVYIRATKKLKDFANDHVRTLIKDRRTAVFLERTASLLPTKMQDEYWKSLRDTLSKDTAETVANYETGSDVHLYNAAAVIELAGDLDELEDGAPELARLLRQKLLPHLQSRAARPSV